MSDKFQTFCFSHSGSWFLPFLWLSLLAGLSACSWTGDDRSDCPSGFRIRLQPALHAQIQPDSGTGVITDETTGETFQAEPFPPFIQKIIRSGGLMASIQAR